MSSGSKVLLGVFAGAAAGAILGVLFAPDRGVETRRRLGEGSRDIATNLKDKFAELVDGIADKYESAREGATDLINRGKEGASDLINKGKEKAAHVAENFGGVNNGGAAAAGGADTNRPSFQS